MVAVEILDNYGGRFSGSKPVEDHQLLVESLAFNELVIAISKIHVLMVTMIIMPVVVVVVTMSMAAAEGSHLEVLGQPEHALRSGL